MTIGIAALCSAEKLGDCVIVSHDTQLSRPFTSSSHAQKSDMVGGKWLALLAANDVSHATELMAEIKARFGSDTSFPAAVRDALAEARSALMLRMTNDLLPVGMPLDRFYSDGKAILPDWAYRDIWSRLTDFRLECELLIAGIGGSGHAHLFTIGADPPMAHDLAGFCAIGSGKWLAIGVLSEYDHSESDDWRDTAYQVYAAKRFSERAPGVGGETVLIRLRSAGADWVKWETLGDLYATFGPLPVGEQWERLRKELKTADLIHTDPPLISWVGAETEPERG